MGTHVVILYIRCLPTLVFLSCCIATVEASVSLFSIKMYIRILRQDNY